MKEREKPRPIKRVDESEESFPSLASSSESENEEDDFESSPAKGIKLPKGTASAAVATSARRNLLDQEMSLKPSSYRPLSATAQARTRELLNSAVRQLQVQRQVLHHHGAGVYETRSCVSSPGKTNFTLREKLRRLSREKKKELLMKSQQDGDGTTLHTEPHHDLTNEDDDGDSGIHETTNTSISHISGFTDSALTRLRRQNEYNIPPVVRSNHIILNIYDLISKDALMQLPWGCMCEIGKCFNDVNSALHELGTGVYHVGVEVNGIEFAYGATSSPGKSGVFSCIPRLSPGFQYRTSIDMGERPIIKSTWIQVPLPNGKTSFRQIEEYLDGREVVKSMASEYMGIDYDLLRKNCCTFARDACLRLGIEEHEIPSWFRNLAESGAMTQDVANATMSPIRKAINATCEQQTATELDTNETGFEVIAESTIVGTKHIVVPVNPTVAPVDVSLIGMRRTLTWTY